MHQDLGRCFLSHLRSCASGFLLVLLITTNCLSAAFCCASGSLARLCQTAGHWAWRPAPKRPGGPSRLSGWEVILPFSSCSSSSSFGSSSSPSCSTSFSFSFPVSALLFLEAGFLRAAGLFMAPLGLATSAWDWNPSHINKSSYPWELFLGYSAHMIWQRLGPSSPCDLNGQLFKLQAQQKLESPCGLNH